MIYIYDFKVFFLPLFFMCRKVFMILTTTPQVQMSQKKINVYTNKGKSMSFTLTYQLIDEDTNTDKDPTYVPSGTTTPL